MYGTSGVMRMRRMWGLLTLTTGPGALSLPSSVVKIELAFTLAKSPKAEGAGAFWKRILPALKYNNPKVPVTLFRYEDAAKPGSLTVHLASQADQTTKKSILLDERSFDDILLDFKNTTQATPIPISDEDADRLRWFETIRQKQEETKKRMKNEELSAKLVKGALAA